MFQMSQLGIKFICPRAQAVTVIKSKAPGSGEDCSEEKDACPRGGTGRPKQFFALWEYTFGIVPSSDFSQEARFPDFNVEISWFLNFGGEWSLLLVYFNQAPCTIWPCVFTHRNCKLLWEETLTSMFFLLLTTPCIVHNVYINYDFQSCEGTHPSQLRECSSPQPSPTTPSLRSTNILC